MARLAAAPVLIAVLAGAPSVVPGHAAARADEYDLARTQNPELFQIYYDEGVMEYCGLQTRESMGGFALRRDDLLKAHPLSEARHRDVRIAAGTALYLEYEDHGLSGQRHWCKTEGLDAYNRFVAAYRAHSGKGNDKTDNNP